MRVRGTAVGWSILLLISVVGGCSRPGSEEKVVASAVAPLADSVVGPATSPAPGGEAPVLVALGDSLTAGLGISPEEAYPAVLQEKLAAAGYSLRVLNAGVSGDTSAGGLRRLDWALSEARGPVVALLVALGGNDGLRGLPVSELRDNLTAIVTEAQTRGLTVVLAGMEAPPNFGETYTAAFRAVFREVANDHDLVFVPFLLDGVAGVGELNQDDGIHPNQAGAARVAENLWPAVEAIAKGASGP